MSRKRRRGKGRKADKYKGTGDTVFHMNSVEATLAKMPYIDGFVCRGGVHGDTRYNRRRSKDDLRRLIDDEG